MLFKCAVILCIVNCSSELRNLRCCSSSIIYFFHKYILLRQFITIASCNRLPIETRLTTKLTIADVKTNINTETKISKRKLAEGRSLSWQQNLSVSILEAIISLLLYITGILATRQCNLKLQVFFSSHLFTVTTFPISTQLLYKRNNLIWYIGNS